MGKSMSIVGKIPCNGGEDCVCDCWQNEKTLSQKMTSRLVKKVFASISNNLYVLGEKVKVVDYIVAQKVICFLVKVMASN